MPHLDRLSRRRGAVAKAAPVETRLQRALLAALGLSGALAALVAAIR